MNKWAYVSVLLAAVLWGTTGTAQNFIEGEAHALTIGAIRLAIGGFSLFAIALLMKKFVWRTVPWEAVVLSAISMALFQPLFFSSVQLTGIAVGTVVAIGSAPVLAGMIEWLVLRKTPGRVWAAATAMAIIGCLLLFANSEAGAVHAGGIAMALGAGLAFAVYAIVSKRVLEEMESVPAVALIFSMSALCLQPFLFLFDLSYIGESRNLALLVYLGIGATSLSYLLFSGGLRAIPSSSAVTLSLAEPLTAALLGVFVVGERLGWISWVGVSLLLGGILVLTLGKGSKKGARDAPLTE
ncbi:DMT family transporter [Planomicrobium sp. YIM 101495]|uniref:DMT family transporter n=1 Tax=Planomicrobium sp. YIM 101495 TaxID=2665160 RepID=UPI0012B89E59|nr:EamA family transporter [Planomicrobium sp. YIM 101495]MTD31263.1 EamA family transporter [Planomicrobium sp. YIM 101495]